MVIPDLRNAIKHYNEIPLDSIKDAKSILDVGSSNGIMAKFSKYSDLFDKINARGNYLGIDCQMFSYTHYLITQADVLDFEPTRKYDLVLALHIIEHFDIGQWKMLFDKLYSWVSEKGYLVVATPFKQKEPLYQNGLDCMKHKVFHIDEQLLGQFLPNGIFICSGERYYYFRDKGESLFYAFLRFFYRIITFHPYSFLKNLHLTKSQRITGVWQKNEV